ncbi:MAG: family 43 glycosylhydrolase, partial [Chitinophagaceae bacterium]
DYYYAFYAAAACCGRECTYQTGIARSKFLLGPWEKYDKNPILKNDKQWKCPGHGTPIEKNGKYYFLYHAYDKDTDVYTGRQGLLIEFRFTQDGWIEFIKKNTGKDVPMTSYSDNFSGRALSTNWQWSVFHPIHYKQRIGELELAAHPSHSGAYLGIKTISGEYTTTVQVKTKRTSATAGLGAIGDDKNSMSVMFKDGVIHVIQLKDGQQSEIVQKNINVGNSLSLQMQVTKGKYFTFFYSTDGKNFKKLNDKPGDGNFLPPWDRSLRVGLIAKGETSQKVTFDKFQLNNK